MNRFRKFQCGFCSSSFLARDHLRYRVYLVYQFLLTLINISGNTKGYILEKNLGNVINVETGFSTETGGKLMSGSALVQNQSLVS